MVRSKTTFNAPLKWKDSLRVFTCSWSDWFIEEADAWREEAYEIIHATPHHTYQILTKRIDRAAEHWPDAFSNAWLGVSVEDRKYGLPRIDILREIPASVRFLSIEPQIEDLGTLDLRGIHWVIIGGESGHGARPFDIAWARSVIEQCRAAGVACFVKQLGARLWAPNTELIPGVIVSAEVKLRNHKGGDPSEWPEDLRVRQFPEVAE